MAYNVNFLKGTAQSFADLVEKNKNTFYYVDEKDLYIGNIKLTNGADLDLAVADITKNKDDIAIIKAQLEDLTGGEGGDNSSLVELISELNSRLTQAEEGLAAEVERSTERDNFFSLDLEQFASDLETLTQTVNTNESDIEGKVSSLTDRVSQVEEKAESNSELLLTTSTKVQEHTTHIAEMQGDIGNLESALNVLTGSDNDKSVRTIAIEVLAEQLLADGLTENFATLQELAAWLADHPEEAAEMNAAIQANTKAISALQGKVDSHGTSIQGILNSLEGIQNESSGILALSKKYTDEKVAVVSKNLDDYIAENDEVVNAIKGKVDAIENPVTGLLAQAQIKIDELTQSLGTAAYKNVEDFDAAGSAAAALNDAKAYTDTALTWGFI